MKSEILTILKENRNLFVSGQRISETFGVTRAAVWKCVKQLESDGYRIESVPKNGYKLLSCPDILTYDEISGYLETERIGRKILYYASVGSTNSRARQMAEAGEPEGTVVVAEEQTGGRGKVGRPWYSQPYQGIWMSLILRPNADLTAASLIMQLACAAVGQAVENLTGTVALKWPNDVFLSGRKVCGVLTESSGEADRADYVIAGIGLNVNQEEGDFPQPLRAKATSLRIETDGRASRQMLAAHILNAFERLYAGVKNPEGVPEAIAFCRAHSAVIGKRILLERHGRRIQAQALDISPQGQLVVQLDDGSVEGFGSGDVSVLEWGG